MPVATKSDLQVWDTTNNIWVTVLRKASGQSATIRFALSERLHQPTSAIIDIVNPPSGNANTRGYVETTYGNYLQPFDRIRVMDTNGNIGAILFYGRIYRVDIEQDALHGPMLKLTCFDQLKEMAENRVGGPRGVIAGKDKMSEVVKELISRYTFKNSAGTNTNLSTGVADKFTDSLSTFSVNPVFNFGTGEATGLTVLQSVANADPISASISDTAPSDNFGFNFYVDHGFIDADLAADPAGVSNSPSTRPAHFNYYKRWNKPSIHHDGSGGTPVYQISYGVGSSDGTSSNDYLTTTTSTVNFNLKKSYTDTVTGAAVTYRKQDGTWDKLICVRVEVNGVSDGSSGNFDYGGLMGAEVPIEESPYIWTDQGDDSAWNPANRGRLIYINGVTGDGKFAVVALDTTNAEEILSVAGTSNQLYAVVNSGSSDGSTAPALAEDRFKIMKVPSNEFEVTRLRDHTFDGNMRAPDIRRAVGALFAKTNFDNSSANASQRLNLQTFDFPMARMTIRPTTWTINSGATIDRYVLPIDLLQYGAGQGNLLTEIHHTTGATGKYGYIREFNEGSTQGCDVQLYAADGITEHDASLNTDVKIHVPIKPGMKVAVTNAVANLSDQICTVIGVDYEEGDGIQTTDWILQTGDTRSETEAVPKHAEGGAADTPVIPFNLRKAKFTPTSASEPNFLTPHATYGRTQLDWCAGILKVGSTPYHIAAGSTGQSGVGESTGSPLYHWYGIYFLPTEHAVDNYAGSDTTFNIARLELMPRNALVIARCMAGEESDIDATYLTQIDIAANNSLGSGVKLKSDGIGGEDIKSNVKITTLSDGTAATPSIAFNDEKDTGFFRYVSGADSWIGVMVDGDISFYFAEGGKDSNTYRTIIPNPTNSIDLGYNDGGGGTDYDWRNIYSVNALSVSSDRRLKEDIQPTNLGLSFVNDLTPVSYKWKKKHDDIMDQRHYGLIAQDVVEVLKDHGIASLEDFGGILHNGNEEQMYKAKYEHFIPILIKAVQELSDKVKQLKEKN